MLQRYDTGSITVKGDGRMKGSGEREREREEGHMPNKQNHIRITIQGFARKQQNSAKKPDSSRRERKPGTTVKRVCLAIACGLQY